IFLTPAEAILAFGDSAAAATPSGDAATPITPDSSLRIQLVGASPDVRATGAGELPGRSNYLIGNDPAEWHTDIATYGRVEYAAVYQGIDLAYYGHAGQLEYDFAVSPGTDPSSISLRFEGADRLDVDSAGDLVLHTSHGEVRQRSPFTYQDIDGQRQQ